MRKISNREPQESRPDKRRRRGRGRFVAHRAEAPALSVRNLSVSYDGRLALSNVSFDVQPGEGLAVVGPNGAGKSTLLKAVSGILTPETGTIEVHGHAPTRHVCIAYVPQRSQVDWRFPVSVFDVVMMGRTGRLGPLRRPGSGDRRLARQALNDVGLIDLADHRIERLSGGQQQRMFIARALAQEAEIVLMDEPLAGLDVHSRDEVLGLLPELQSRRVTVVVALHDLGVASSRFDLVLLLKGSVLGFGGPGEVFTTRALQQAYGSCLRMSQTDDGVLVVHDSGCTGEES